MINGIKPSELEMRNRSLIVHYDKLTSIVNGQSSRISTFTKNFHSIVRKKKQNHTKWRNFKLNEEQDKLIKQNDIVKDKIIKILTSKHKLTPSSNHSFRDFSRSNYFYEKRRFQTSIDRQNPEIAKRIVKVTPIISHKKDSEDFKKSRQFVKRLERFPVLKRLQQSVQQSRLRIKTEDNNNSRPRSLLSKSISPVIYFAHPN